MPERMTAEHPRWKEFLVRLSGPEGCHFRDDPEPTWTCDGTLDIARRILTAMDVADVDGSLAYFEEYGGYCDCEILFNVAANTETV